MHRANLEAYSRAAVGKVRLAALLFASIALCCSRCT
jgi:hypothetical protein